MNYCGLNKNDIAAAPGFSVTLYVSGCDKHCPGCHNPETWDPNYGKPLTWDVITEIIDDLNSCPVTKNLCLMGGDPLHPNNVFHISVLIAVVKDKCPKVPIYLWTGYTWEELQLIIQAENNVPLKTILQNIDYLIDGPFIQEERDITLQMRGSRNQRIIKLTNGEIISIIK